MFDVTVSSTSVTSLGSCDGILDDIGEFALQVNVRGTRFSNRVVHQTASYPGNSSNPAFLNLRLAASRTFSGRRTISNLSSKEADTITVEFRATEWDKRVVLIPPSTRNVRDSDMNNRSVVKVHRFTANQWSDLGPTRLFVGSGSCRVRLDYDITATRQ